MSSQILTRAFLAYSLALVFLFENPTAAQNIDSIPLKTNVPEQQLISDLESFVPELMERAEVPGLSIAIIRDAEIILHGAYGVRNINAKDAVNDSTIFQAASLSKTLFAYAVLRMVEKGEFDLDTPLSDYFGAAYINNDDRVHQISARTVLSHTTGFPNWRQPRDGDLKMHFSPGEKFSYSGEGYVYLQRVVEKLADKSFNDFMAESVFEPLGMRHSSYEWREAYANNLAVGHGEFGVPIDRDPMTKGNAAFSLYTTAIDYAKFMIAIMTGAGLAKETLREMLSPQIYLNDDCLNCTQNSTSNLSEVNAWGLGWGLQLTDEGTSFWHWGDQGIFRCYTVAFQEQKIGMVYFTNSENGLAIRDELVLRAIGGRHPAFSWLHYDSYKSPGKKFAKLILKQGMAAGMAFHDSLKNESKDAAVFDERAINRLGYHFLFSKQFDKAIAIFKFNIKEYPDSWNVYDSLAEAYMKDGHDELAIKYYEKSLKLNPDNTNGKEMLEKIRTAAK